jgi:hypothetical protein
MKGYHFMSDQMETLAVIIGALWVFFKSTSFLFLRRSDHLERLYEALEVGVHVAWVNVIKPCRGYGGSSGEVGSSHVIQFRSLMPTRRHRFE